MDRKGPEEQLESRSQRKWENLKQENCRGDKQSEKIGARGGGEDKFCMKERVEGS